MLGYQAPSQAYSKIQIFHVHFATLSQMIFAHPPIVFAMIVNCAKDQISFIQALRLHLAGFDSRRKSSETKSTYFGQSTGRSMKTLSMFWFYLYREVQLEPFGGSNRQSSETLACDCSEIDIIPLKLIHIPRKVEQIR